MHDLTDDDRAHLVSIATFLEGQFRHSSIKYDVAFLRKLAEQSPGDQGLRITNEMVERAARAGYERERSQVSEPGPPWDEVLAEQGRDGDFARAWRAIARTYLAAAFTDSTDNQQED